MSQLFHLPRQTLLNGSVQLLAGAKANFYLTGTTTPQNVYTTSALSVAHSNPVVADANGVFPAIWWDQTIPMKVTVTTAANVLIYTEDPISETFTQAQIGGILYPRTAAEIAAGVTPTNFAFRELDVRRYGASTSETAANNSTYIQRALTVAESAGGGKVYVPRGTYFIDTPLLIRDNVGLYGDGYQASILKKTTATASSVSDSTLVNHKITLGYDAQTANFAVGEIVTGGTSTASGMVLVDTDSGATGTLTLWYIYGTFQNDEALTGNLGGAATVNGVAGVVSVGNPVCVAHAVATNGNSWAYGHIHDIAFFGDSASPNTSVVEYGLFTRGVNSGTVERCWAENVRVGFFYSGGATLVARIQNNYARNTWMGHYQHFMTSTAWNANYANNYRFIGFFASWYYSHFEDCAADAGGTTHQVTTKEFAIAYWIASCRGGSFSNNGCETSNCAVWKWEGCRYTRFENNIALEISSPYNGSSDVTLLNMINLMNCERERNVVQTQTLTGTAARHFKTKVSGDAGNDRTWQGNRFVAAIADTTDTTGWSNTTGTISEDYEEGTFTVTLTGISGVDPTGTARWVRYRNVVNLFIPSLSGTSDSTTALLQTVPASIRPVRQRRCIVRVRDNGVVNEGSAMLETNGNVTLSYGPTEAAFTASGVKSIFESELVYSLT